MLQGVVLYTAALYVFSSSFVLRYVFIFFQIGAVFAIVWSFAFRYKEERYSAASLKRCMKGAARTEVLSVTSSPYGRKGGRGLGDKRAKFQGAIR